MKEIIDSLNLPKQILDKTEKFMSKLLGPSIKEFGELYADNVRFRRLKNQVKIFNKTRELLDNNGLEPRELNLKTLVPLLEKASVEESEILQNKWSSLIANIASTPENGLEPKLINTLGSLSALEAQILDFIYKMYLINRIKKFEQSIKNLWGNWKNESDVPLNYVLILFKSVKEKFNLTDEFTSIYIDNLESLGLIRFEEPEIEIDNGYPSGDVFGKSVEIELDVSATYIHSDNFYLTTYGNYFIKQCKVK
ncbi:Abi-alpha family protein [Formosa undariae]|uniref:Abi-alpha family protein n=1 Tax=Formosa undariae TaxID=1325436 RepID=A0ABV5F5B0_9FLAO